ncbi:6-phosphogluconolactonase [Bryobacterales bacterium F-183]|nr:6-phosphogluconolactonase [Bryobacterales bacterium F-183]
MSHRVIIRDTPQLAAQACAERVLELLQSLTLSGHASFAVSGGSTPKLMFQALAELSKDTLDWNRVHLFWVDERAVPPSDPDSNYKLAKDYLIDPAGIPESNIHRVHGELPPEEAAALYAKDLATFFGDHPPVIDVLHCGMGPDAHTASLFPGSALIHDTEGLAAAVYAPKLPNWRVTLLPKVLLSARHTLMLATGSDKADTLRAVFDESTYDPLARPVQLIAKEGRDVAWYLDRAAAPY